MKFFYTIILLLTIGCPISSANAPKWETDFYALLTTVGKPWSAVSQLLDTPSSINKIDADTEELIYSYCTIYLRNSIVSEIWFKEDPSEKCIKYKREIFENFTFCGGLFEENLSVEIFLNFIGTYQEMKESKSFDQDSQKWIKTKHYYWLDKGLELVTKSETNSSDIYGSERISSLGIKSKLVSELYLRSQNFPTKLNNLAFFMEGNKTYQLMEKLLGKPLTNTQTDGAWEVFYPAKGFAFSYDNLKESFSMVILTNKLESINGLQYPHKLPFGLNWKMRYGEVLELLGQPDNKVNENGQIKILYQQKSMLVVFEEASKKMLMIQFGRQSTSYLL